MSVTRLVVHVSPLCLAGHTTKCRALNIIQFKSISVSNEQKNGCMCSCIQESVNYRLSQSLCPLFSGIEEQIIIPFEALYNNFRFHKMYKSWQLLYNLKRMTATLGGGSTKGGSVKGAVAALKGMWLRKRGSGIVKGAVAP